MRGLMSRLEDLPVLPSMQMPPEFQDLPLAGQECTIQHLKTLLQITHERVVEKHEEAAKQYKAGHPLPGYFDESWKNEKRRWNKIEKRKEAAQYYVEVCDRLASISVEVDNVDKAEL